MYQFPIGVMLDSFLKPIPEAMDEVVKIGATGMQLYARNDYAPEKITSAKTRELLQWAKSRGLMFSAICGDFGKSFDQPERNKILVENSKRVLEFAKELETNVVTTHIGSIPDDPTCEKYKIMQEACFQLCEFADSVKAHFAIETGSEPAPVLRKFLDSLHSNGVAVNFDPANLTYQDPYGTVKDVYTLKDYIVHTHAKDAVNLNIHDEATQKWYRENAKVEDVYYCEVPLGKGDVPYPAYLKALEDIGYRGFLTIERECGNNPTKDIGEAADYLRNELAK